MKQFNNEEFPRYVRTAGKVTILTAVIGLVVFFFALMVDVGTHELSRVSAQTATTSLTVLNTPPSFTVNAHEVVESSTSSPTNSGDLVQWAAIANDSNDAPYFLLICETNATPTANAATSSANLGTAAPECASGVTQWAVSAATPSDSEAVAATTTTEVAPFLEVNTWYAWVCDDDPFNPRCNNTPVQGLSATNSSPFNVNKRPTFSALVNDGPVDPGGTLVFDSTSDDLDVAGGEDTIYLIVCSSNTDYSTSTNTCANDFIASTTISVLSDASATYTLPAIIRDDTYTAYGYIIDQHGHEASANPIQADFDVNNVAPVLLSSEIEVGGRNGVGTDIIIDIAGGETPSSTLSFTISDANSCVTAASTTDEIRGFEVAVYRTSVGTTTCDTTSANYDPNNCYPSGVGTSVWDLQCTATTTCTNPLQDEMSYTCTYPLWFVADPTDNGVNTPPALEADSWSAAVLAYDDNSATSSLVASAIPVDLISYAALDVLAAAIAYGSIEPGDNNPNLSATSTVINVGNTGIDQEVRGESMCDLNFFGVVVGNCPNYATSSIPDWRQQFATTTYSYDVDATEGGGSLDPNIFQLASTSPGQELELNVPKTTATSTPQEGTTYWGIAVPIAISLAGNYSGLNTFTARTSENTEW